MNEINNINIKGIGPDHDTSKSEKKPVDVTGEAFDQLLENLKSVESEMDVAFNNPSAQNTTAVSNSVNALGNYIRKIEGIVEKISPDNQTNPKSIKFAISQYEQGRKPE